MQEVVAILVTWVTVTAFNLLVIAKDERRLAPEQLARAWPPASRGVAIYGFFMSFPFALIAVPVHFFRTRRGWRGAALAFFWTGAVVALLEIVGAAVDMATEPKAAPLSSMARPSCAALRASCTARVACASQSSSERATTLFSRAKQRRARMALLASRGHANTKLARRRALGSGARRLRR